MKPTARVRPYLFRALVLALVAASLTTFGFPSAVAVEPGLGSASGFVRGVDGTRLSGVLVEAFASDAGAEAEPVDTALSGDGETAGLGDYTLDLPEGLYRLRYSGEGLMTRWYGIGAGQVVDVYEGSDALQEPVTMSPAVDAVIHGFTVRPDGRRVNDIVVEAWAPGALEPSATARSYEGGGESNGYVALYVAPGTYEIRYSDPRGRFADGVLEGTVTVGSGEAAFLGRIDLAVPRGTVIASVVDSDDVPQAGVSVTAWRFYPWGQAYRIRRGTTDDAGQVTFTEIMARRDITLCSDRQDRRVCLGGRAHPRRADRFQLDDTAVPLSAPALVRGNGALDGAVVDGDGEPFVPDSILVWEVDSSEGLRGRRRLPGEAEFVIGDLDRDKRYTVCVLYRLSDDTRGQACLGGASTPQSSDRVLVPADAEGAIELSPIVIDPVRLTGRVVDETGEPIQDAFDVYVYRVDPEGAYDAGYGYAPDGSPYVVGVERGTSGPLTVCVQVWTLGASGCLGGGQDPAIADTFTLPAEGSVVELADIVVDLPCQGSVITNGTVSLGVNCLGQLNIDMVGLKYNETGNDSTFAGCPCEGWGVADATSLVSGFANNSSGISNNLELIDFSLTRGEDEVPVTATSVVRVDDSFVITHDYRPSPLTPNAYEVNVSVENITETAQDLRYRRVMDWDVEPTPFNEYVTMQRGDAEELVFTSNDGFASADPLAGPSDIGFTGDFVDAGPNDHGALFDFSFGTLAPGEVKTFHTYYGAAGTEGGAMDALSAISAEAYSLGQPSTTDGPTLGTPNTFLFAFSGVGGSAVTPPTAGDDEYVVAADAEDELLSVLDNDSTAIPGRAPRIVSSTQPENGTVTCDASICRYTPDAGFGTDSDGEDSFTYTITDGRGGFDTATVSLVVTDEGSIDNTGLPVVTGTGKVGSPLTGTDGTWTPTSGLDFTYRWLRSDRPAEGTAPLLMLPISKATDRTYTPSAADLGHLLALEVTASQDGAAPVRAVSEAKLVVEGAAPAPTSAPSIPTTIRVGELVSVNVGRWSPAPTSFGYQWFLDDEAVAGATSGSFLPKPGDEDKSLHVVVTTRLAGYAPGFAHSHSVVVQVGPAPTNSGRPVLTGTPAVGQVLTASPGTWAGSGLTFLYEYSVDDEVVRELSDDPTWVVAGDPGQEVRVRVVARKPGQADGEASSSGLVIGAVAATFTTAPSFESPVMAEDEVEVVDADFDGEDLEVTTTWFASYSDDRSLSPYRFYLGEGEAFTVPSWMGGYYLEVEQVAMAAGKAQVPATSARVLVQSKPSLYGDYRYLAGSPQVGQSSSVPAGRWISYDETGAPVEESGVEESVQWYVDGRQVGSGPSYTPVDGDGGGWLYAYITGTKATYLGGSAYVSGQRIRFSDEGEASLRLRVRREGAGGLNVPDTSVAVCSDASGCTYGTATDGRLTVAVPARGTGTDVRVTVTPPFSTGLLARTTTTRVVAGETTDLEVRVASPTPIPTGTTLTDTIGSTPVDVDGDGTSDGSFPTVYYSDPQTLTVAGCPGIDPATWSVEFDNGSTPMTGTLSEESDGVYTGLIPGFTSTGRATISTNVPLTCDGEPVEFSLYIDPSGIVTDQFGRPLVGARATLLHLVGGDMVPVPDQSAVMSPKNQDNPSFTDNTGFFRWDVVPGTYQVQVSDATSQGADCEVTTTPRMDVPPERVDLLIKVPCPTADDPVPSTSPVLSGTPTVGQTLSVSQGAWEDGIVYERTEWVRDGGVVGTGSTYNLTGADSGKKITARVVARRPSYVQENRTGELVVFDPTSFEVESAVIAAAPVTPGGPVGGSTITNTTKPSVGGMAKVGRTLTANPGTWNVDGLTFAYQWLRDGNAIVSATSSDYRAVAADRGTSLSVLVTATKAGSTSGSATSEAVLISAGDAPVSQVKPLVTGTPEVGETLNVSNGTWDLDELTFAYQWLRDGEAIEGATAATYVVTEGDLGAELTARVTASKAGHEDGSAVASGLTVPGEEEPADPAPSTTKATLLGEKIKQGERGEVRVKVTSEGESVPTGTLTVTAGRKSVEAELTEADNGKAKITLPKLKPGTYDVSVTYSGDDATEGSADEAGTLKVKKKGKKGKGKKADRTGGGRPMAALL